MNSQIFEEIGEFLPPFRKDKTFQSIKYWRIIKKCELHITKNSKCKNINKWNRKIFTINIIKSYISLMYKENQQIIKE